MSHPQTQPQPQPQVNVSKTVVLPPTQWKSITETSASIVRPSRRRRTRSVSRISKHELTVCEWITFAQKVHNLPKCPRQLRSQIESYLVSGNTIQAEQALMGLALSSY